MVAIHQHYDIELREARPRVVAALLRVFGDIDLAEDLYQEACIRALRSWPQDGIPDNVAGWLIRVGRNAGIDHMRRQVRQSNDDPEDLLDQVGATQSTEADLVHEIDAAHYKDDILRLMFMCCHDELTPNDQLALALKVVVGLSVAEIARAFVVSEDAMEQRITRAKKKASGVAKSLEVPGLAERAERLRAVITMVYLLFNEGYGAQAGDDHIRVDLCAEAIRLARLLRELFPAQTEVLGLLALCLLQGARQHARLNEDGQLLSLAEQDRSLWDKGMIGEGASLIAEGLSSGQRSVMLLQAAISLEHCKAADAAHTDWVAIHAHYEQLEELSPSPVVTLNRAVAVSEIDGPEVALDLLDGLSPRLDRYRPYHTTKAALFEKCGQDVHALSAYRRAFALGGSKAEQDYVAEKIAVLEK